MGNNGEVSESLVVFQNSQGMEIRASLLRVTRYLVVFEIYSPGPVLRISEVLSEFRIHVNDRPLYSGKAVVSSLVNTGPVLVCEAKLDESGLSLDLLTANGDAHGPLAARFTGFLGDWQKLYRVQPEFKAVMADLQNFLMDLRLWLEQVELEIRSSPSSNRTELERQAVDDLVGPAVQAIDSFVERFEAIAAGLEVELQPMHRIYLRRQLHPLLLCSPFAYRAFNKPLGYAGDYEVVDMMLRPPHEGSNLFAKIINVWLLGQSPVRAHRNRVDYLYQKLVEESTRVRAQGRPTRVFNLGCGPAGEIQRFLREDALSDRAEFTLADFNDETLMHVRRLLEEAKNKYGRRTPIQLVKKSVHQLLKESARSVTGAVGTQFDFVYCAGLFDYLSDQVCKRLMNILYGMVSPGGLLLATNVSDALNCARPFRYSMDYMLDWQLLYRDGEKVAQLTPDGAPADAVKVITEDMGVNVFIEVRKPRHA